MRGPVSLEEECLSRLKLMSGMNIAEKRSPQDGRIKIIVEPDPIDFRVSACPAYHGESVVLRILRPDSVKIGLVKLRFVRPWPTQEVAEVLSRFKAVGVVETSTSYGGAMRGGNLLHEVRASLYDCPQRPLTTSFMAGLGGEMVPLKEFYWMAEVMTKALQDGKMKKNVFWVNHEKEA